MNYRFCFAAVLLAVIALSPVRSEAASAKKKEKFSTSAPSPWTEWVEPEFPFFSSILDARQAGAGLQTNNLTPRGLVLNLGNNLWACFDTDLLRVAAIWQGEEGKPSVTPNALAPKSYHLSGGKTPGGQFPAPEPVGRV